MLLTIIYIIAITAEAMTGALSAGRRSIGLVWCGDYCLCSQRWAAVLSAMCYWDIIRLTWVKHPEYLMLTCFAAFMTILIAKWMCHLRNIFLVLDALGLIGFIDHRLSELP